MNDIHCHFFLFYTLISIKRCYRVSCNNCWLNYIFLIKQDLPQSLPNQLFVNFNKWQVNKACSTIIVLTYINSQGKLAKMVKLESGVNTSGEILSEKFWEPSSTWEFKLTNQKLDREKKLTEKKNRKIKLTKKITSTWKLEQHQPKAE